MEVIVHLGVVMDVVIISLDDHLVSSDGRMLFLTTEWDFSGAAQKRNENQFNLFPFHLMFVSALRFSL